MDLSRHLLKPVQRMGKYALLIRQVLLSSAFFNLINLIKLQHKQLELGDKMDLSSYLLKPVQKMGKYALLIKQILLSSAFLSH